MPAAAAHDAPPVAGATAGASADGTGGGGGGGGGGGEAGLSQAITVASLEACLGAPIHKLLREHKIVGACVAVVGVSAPRQGLTLVPISAQLELTLP